MLFSLRRLAFQSHHIPLIKLFHGLYFSISFHSVIPNEGVAVVKILVFNFPLICLNSCSDKYPQKTLSLKWSIVQITRFPHYFVSTDAMLGFYRKFKGVSFKVEMYTGTFNIEWPLFPAAKSLSSSFLIKTLIYSARFLFNARMDHRGDSERR